jgi:murein DD-endopeptidase MepM/ murein hydrolase activator NlpD
VTSIFGIGRVFNGQLRSRHLGTDYDGVVGAPVRAANRGVVALIGDFYYAGRIVSLNHGAGLITSYLHLSEILVAEGDTVSPGQFIGRVGASGRVTGPHLHWAVRVGASAVDGASLLALPPLERLFGQ